MKIEFSKQSKSDIIAIRNYTKQRYGSFQARKYVEGMREKIGSIAVSPNILRSVDHIFPGFFRMNFESHAVFAVKTNTSGLLIVRILHQSTDFKAQLKI